MSSRPVVTDTEETRYGTLDLGLLKRFLGFAGAYRGWLLVAGLLAPLGVAIQLAQPLVVRAAVDDHLASGNMAGFGWVLAAYGGLIVGQLALSYLQSVVNSLLGQRVVRDMRRALFDHLTAMDAGFFAANASGRLTNRLTNDTEVVSQMVSAGIINLITDLLLLVGIAISMASLSPQLSLVALVALPAIILGTLLVARRMRLAQREGRLLQAGMASLLTEEIEGHQVVRLFHRQGRNDRAFGKLNRRYYDAALKSNFFEAFQFSFVETVSTAAIAGLFWYGGALHASPDAAEAVTIGTLIAFIDYLRRIFFPIRDLSSKFTTLQAAMTALERIFDLLDQRPAIVDPAPEKQRAPAADHGAPIQFSQVHFSYGQQAILHDIDLEIAAGERVAVAGPTGAGKSTLIKLINRTHDPASGVVSVDGVDLRRLPLDRLRRMVGVVQQDTFLFAGTAAQNIGLDDPGVTRERIRESAERCGVMTFAQDWPRGLDTPLAERGVNLSAGQRQLLGIARVLAFDPRILVMDEATSSVDTITERLIQDALRALLGGRTAVIIAHRLSTILDADRIITLADGRIAEQGRHEELLRQGGLYARLYALQFEAMSA